MQEWRYNTTHILNVDTPCRYGSASRGGRFNLRKEFPVSKVQKTVWTSAGSWCFAVKYFCPCRECNCYSSAIKTEDKLNIFNNAVRLNSMQHWPSSEPLCPQPVKVAPALHGTKRHHVQNSQPLKPIRSQVNHGQNIRYYFWKINFNIILPSAPRSFKWSPSFSFPNQKAICISLPPVCATRFPPLIILHLINTNNIWSGARIMKISSKRIFPSSCHFLRVTSKYLPHHSILEYRQPLFVRQHRRPSSTPISNIRRNYSFLIRRSK